MSLSEGLAGVLEENLKHLVTNSHENVQQYAKLIARDLSQLSQYSDTMAALVELHAQAHGTAELLRIELNEASWAIWETILDVALNVLRVALESAL